MHDYEAFIHNIMCTSCIFFIILSSRDERVRISVIRVGIRTYSDFLTRIRIRAKESKPMRDVSCPLYTDPKPRENPTSRVGSDSFARIPDLENPHPFTSTF